jgi:hypothetical protein
MASAKCAGVKRLSGRKSESALLHHLREAASCISYKIFFYYWTVSFIYLQD